MDGSLVIANVRRLLTEASEAVTAVWVVVPQGRDHFAATLMADRGDLPLVACVVRNVAFDDPNTLLQDLVRVLGRHRTVLEDEALRNSCRATGRLCCVLVARRELGVPFASSPVTLPEWFPVVPGQLCDARITDLTWQLRAPLADPSLKAGGIAHSLFELEGLMLLRLKAVHQRNHNLTNAFFDRIRSKNSSETFLAFLDAVSAARRATAAPQHYRPSVREGTSVIARIWRLANSTAPDQLTAVGRALAMALAVSDQRATDQPLSIFGVLTRPAQSGESPSARWGRNMVSIVGTCCQLLTASAHADQYPRFPITLLRSLSLELRTALEASFSIFRALVDDEVSR